LTAEGAAEVGWVSVLADLTPGSVTGGSAGTGLDGEGGVSWTIVREERRNVQSLPIYLLSQPWEDPSGASTAIVIGAALQGTGDRPLAGVGKRFATRRCGI